MTARGVCWSTSPNPSTANSKTTNGNGVGIFTSSLTGLTANTPYYVRAYATNSYGTAYGNEVTFTTSSTGNQTGTFTDPRDNKTYQWVKIGDQTWMAENLAFLPAVSPSSQGSSTAPFYYVYDYQGTDVLAAKATSNYNTFGVLYNWPAAMAGASNSAANPSGVQGVCPSGWHLPSDAEWIQLENYLIANGYNYDGTSTGNKIAKSMAATTNWNTYSDTGTIGNNLSLNNKSGFSALPGGYRDHVEGAFDSVGYGGTWWGGTENGSSGAWGRGLVYFTADMYRGNASKALGFSVRCVKDISSALPDLSISASVSGSIQAGESKQIQVSVTRTEGNLTNGSYVEAHLYLSKTTTLGSDKVQLWVSNNSTPDFPISLLNSSSSKTVTATVTIPENTIAGSYYIIAIVDEVNFHPETNETNNSQSNSIIVEVQSTNQTGTFTDSRDNKTYQWVKIGDQTWMAENLAFLPAVSPSSLGSASTPYYYVYDYQGTEIAAAKATENYKTYGVLYNWHSAIIVCPAGWHLPNSGEWATLVNYLTNYGYGYSPGGNDIAKSLAAPYKWNYYSTVGSPGNNPANNNGSGFSGLPAGNRLGTVDGLFYGIGNGTSWWSSTASSDTSAVSRYLGYSRAYLYINEHPKTLGNSVRCIKDNPSTLPDLSISAPVSGSIQAGASIQIQVAVTKAGGNLTNGSYVEAHLYLSKTSTLGSDKVRLWVSNNSTPDFPNSVLNSNGLKTVTATVTVPTNTVAGNYYIIAVVDEINYHLETNETNNTQSHSITITTQTILPDLTISATVTGSIQAGTSKQIPVTITKAGGSLTNGSYVEAHLYLSKTSTLGSDKVLLWISNNSIPDFPNSMLNTGSLKTVTATVSIPGNTIEGNYYIIAVVDEIDYHPETNETNNTHSNLVTITSQTTIQTGTFSDTRDNKSYKWVKIGDQTWMAENLAYLPSVSQTSQGSPIVQHYYVYDYNGTDVTEAKMTYNYKAYGVLYNYPSAAAACPSGWHLPSVAEWKQLEKFLSDNGYNYDGTIGGGTNKIAKSLAATMGWGSSSALGTVGNNLQDNNKSGFTALPGGRRNGDHGIYTDLYVIGAWWSSTQVDNFFTWNYLMHSFFSDLRSYGEYNGHAFSVRCIKD